MFNLKSILYHWNQKKKLGIKLEIVKSQHDKSILDKEVESDVCLTLTSSDLAGILKVINWLID